MGISTVTDDQSRAMDRQKDAAKQAEEKVKKRECVCGQPPAEHDGRKAVGRDHQQRVERL